MLLAPTRGSPIRSMLRHDAAARLRILEGATGGLWGSEPFLMKMVALGPAIHVPHALYLRWDKRPGGLMDDWSNLPLEMQLAGIKETVKQVWSVLDVAAFGPEETMVLRFGLFLHILGRVVKFEKRFERRVFRRPEQLHPIFAGLDSGGALSWLSRSEPRLAEVAAWARKRWSWAQRDLHRRAAAT